ncbi:MFS transporter [Streptomyces sp. BA2]|uniref:MFS transporter n=1 Tax=Streptomyces sp. BA2 TaxID=436595 RepID=UPI0013245837|nr:MFS transporter [Streptomyces sp. BA2]MWA14625.1 MFS transporter [Streptomyces sp. BA2]
MSTQQTTIRDQAARKVMVRLIPLLMVVYFTASIDKANIAMAKDSLGADIGLSAAAYGLGAGIFFISYMLLEIPSNLILHKVGPRWWIGRISVTWGVVTAATMFVHDEWTFYLARVLLGAAEAGLYGLMYLVSVWLPQAKRAKAVGLLLASATTAGIAGAPIGSGLLSLDGTSGLHGWQWMFLIEGAASVVIGIVVWVRLPSRPENARWLRAEEASALTEAAAERGPTDPAPASTISASLTNPTVLISAAVYLLLQAALSGPVFFGPAMVEEMGVSGTPAIGGVVALVTVGPLLGVLLLPRIYRRTGTGSEWALIAGSMSAALAASLALPSARGVVAQALLLGIAMLLVMGIATVVWAFAMTATSGVGAAAALAAVNSIGALGAFAGPFAFGSIEQSTGSALNGMYLVAALAAAIVVLTPLVRSRQRSTAAASTGTTRVQLPGLAEAD